MGDIKTRFVLEGESQFRSAMNNAASSVKTLNAEQKLAKAQFQQTGDAEKYMAAQARILQEKLTAQKAAVQTAGAALKKIADEGGKGSKAWDTWNMKLLAAQTAMTNTETELQNLGSSMTDTTDKADKTSSAVGAIGKKVSFDAVISGLDKITSKMEAVAKKAVDLVSQLQSTMSESAAWADDLLTDATVYGIDEDTLQRMRYTADVIDTDVETIIKSRQKLRNAMVYGSADAEEAFAELGISTKKTGISSFFDGTFGNYRDWEDVFWKAGDALINYADQEEAAAKANKIFGRSWEQLRPMFIGWQDKLDENGNPYESAREYYEATMAGWDTVSDENVKKLADLDDANQKLQNDFETLKNTITASLAPAFTDATNAISDLLSEFNKYLATDEGQQQLADLSQAVADLFSGLTDVDFGAAIQTAKDALTKLTEGLGWIKDNWSSVESALRAIGDAFLAMKVSNGVLTFLNSANAVKNLFGGDSGGTPAPTSTAAPTSGGGGGGIHLPAWAGPAMLIGGGAVGMWNMFWDYQDKQRVVADQLYAEDAARSAEVASKNNRFSDAYAVLETYRDMLANAEEVAPVMAEIAEKEDFLAAANLAGYEGTDWEREAATWAGGGWINLIGDDTFGGIFGAMMDNLKQKSDAEPLEVPVKPDPDVNFLQKCLDAQDFSAVVELYPQIKKGGEKVGGFFGFPHADGLDYVPYDGYPAILHRGERVLTRSENERGGVSMTEVTRAVANALSNVNIYLGSDQVGNLTTHRVSTNITKTSNSRLRSYGG